VIFGSFLASLLGHFWVVSGVSFGSVSGGFWSCTGNMQAWVSEGDLAYSEFAKKAPKTANKRTKTDCGKMLWQICVQEPQKRPFLQHFAFSKR
jgi:hypothetical protein